MDDFKDNKCRVCKIVFCCKSCREKHESNKHKIFPDCDVCFHGKTILKNPSQPLLEHLKTAHWPLHCVLCKRLFGSTDELLNQGKCPVGHKTAEDMEKSPYTPLESYNYESPPLSALYSQDLASKNPNLFCSLATSTPMQKGENNILEKMQIITPVDYSEMNTESIIKKKRLNNNRSDSPKRKVTFSDTPLAESNRKQKTTSKKPECQNSDMNYSTPNLGSSGSTFYSIREEALQEDAKINENNEYPVGHSENVNSEIEISDGDVKVAEEENNKIEKENVPMKQEDSTMWVSANNLSTLEVTDEEKQPEVTPPKINLNTLATPMVTKSKKRQINIVMPTPVVKENISITATLPVEVFSTPLSYESDLEGTDEELPVKLEPNSSICKLDGNTPSTSKRELEECDIPYHQANNNNENITSLRNNDIKEDSSDISISVHSRLWSSMSKLLRNVTNSIGQDFSSVNENSVPNSSISFKRSFTDFDSLDVPCAKRFKLTEIKCRRTIRELPTIEITKGNTSIRYSQSIKTFADKATQTDN